MEMGMHAIPAKTLGKIPTYYVTHTVQQNAGNGNIRILNYENINGVLVPQFQCIIASCVLVTVGRNITEFALDIFSAEQLRVPGMKVH